MPSELNKAIGETLRMYREDREETLASLAQKLRVHKSDLSKYELGVYRIPADVLINALFELYVDAQVFCDDVYPDPLTLYQQRTI